MRQLFVTRVARLVRAGFSDAEIAETLRCHLASVHTVLKLSERDSKIRELTALGKSQRQIADAVNVSRNCVYLTQKRLGLSGTRPGMRPGTYRRNIPPKKLARIVADIRARRETAMALSKKYKIRYGAVLQLSHEELACERFRSGRIGKTNPPLDSDLPQKYYDRETHGASI